MGCCAAFSPPLAAGRLRVSLLLLLGCMLWRGRGLGDEADGVAHDPQLDLAEGEQKVGAK
eukprot:COSAG01_NODE_8650_length_2707_cov_69.318252_2_plen_60_part_00